MASGSWDDKPGVFHQHDEDVGTSNDDGEPEGPIRDPNPNLSDEYSADDGDDDDDDDDDGGGMMRPVRQNAD